MHVCVFVHTSTMSEEARESALLSGVRVVGSCKPFYVRAGNLGPLQEQFIFLTPEPFL